MVKKVSIRKNIMTIEWDQADADHFFCVGMQQLADEHFGGERKVVVVPLDGIKLESTNKTIEVSDDFVHSCIEYGVNHALRSYIDSIESSKTSGKKKIASAKQVIRKQVK